MNKKERDAYNLGYFEGKLKGKLDAELMKLNADGCVGCAFEHVEEWEMPCAKCKRNCKDYWRAKKVE